MALATLPDTISTLFDPANENSPFYTITSGLQTLLGDSTVDGSIANWFSLLPQRIVDGVGDLLGTLKTNIFDPVENFFTGTGEGTIAWIIDQGVQWFASLPNALIVALQSLGASAYNAVVVPIINVLNSMADVVQRIIQDLAHSIGTFIADTIENPAANLGITIPGLSDFRASLINAGLSFRIPHISTALPAFLVPTPGAAEGGLFSDGMLRVGEQGQEFIANANKMAVFPNSFVQALDRLTSALIAQPIGYPMGAGGDTYNNQQYITMNGVRDGSDAARRFARLRARG